MGEALAQAFGQVLDPTVLTVIALSAIYGTLFGSIPGLSATMAVALIVPLSRPCLPKHHARLRCRLDLRAAWQLHDLRSLLAHNRVTAWVETGASRIGGNGSNIGPHQIDGNHVRADQGL